MAQASANSVNASLNKLHLSPNAALGSKAKKAEPAESWEDEADESSDPDAGATTPVRPRTAEIPGPPPPTPSSPSFLSSFQAPQLLDYAAVNDSASSNGSRHAEGDDRRPDKTTAIASRLIAAGIGQRAPKRTEEQRQYDQAMKTQEKKKRDQAREEEERKKQEKARAQRDVWGD